jgi:hypothetical protein
VGPTCFHACKEKKEKGRKRERAKENTHLAWIFKVLDALESLGFKDHG